MAEKCELKSKKTLEKEKNWRRRITLCLRRNRHNNYLWDTLWMQGLWRKVDRNQRRNEI